MPVIFENVEYSANYTGKYYCPYDCHNPDYPKPSWKTDKGFLGHLEKCLGRVDASPRRKSEPIKEEEKQLFGKCPDCGSDIWTYESVWTMPHSFVCIDCYLPYYEKGIGFHDCAGFILPDASLTA